MKLVFKNKEEFENFCNEGSVCPGDLGCKELEVKVCCSGVNCQGCWKQSGAEIIFEDDQREHTCKKKSSEILMSLGMSTLDVFASSSGKINVSYKGADIKDGMFLVSAYGRGNTFEEACDDYLSQIRGKTLVFNAYSENRREVTVLG